MFETWKFVLYVFSIWHGLLRIWVFNIKMPGQFSPQGKAFLRGLGAQGRAAPVTSTLVLRSGAIQIQNHHEIVRVQVYDLANMRAQV